MVGNANMIAGGKRYQKFNRRTEQGGKFRILVGSCIDDCPPGCQCDRVLDHKDTRNHLYETYECYAQRLIAEKRKDEIVPEEEYTNHIIDSKRDLCGRMNADPRDPSTHKFERLTNADGTPVNSAYAAVARMALPPQAFPVEKMTYPQMLTYAAEEEIDLKGASKKEDVIRIIKQAEAAKTKS